MRERNHDELGPDGREPATPMLASSLHRKHVEKKGYERNNLANIPGGFRF